MKKVFLMAVITICSMSGYSITAGTASHLSQVTVFNAGENDVNTYRIPTIVVANDGSIIVAAEARRISWQDKSRTDVVAKRSVDGGKTWSEMKDLTNDTTGAYMDPSFLIDRNTGRIFLFCNFWPFGDHSGKGNIPFLITSDDNGQTWSDPVDVSDEILLPDTWSMGFGPGSGIQMEGEKFSGRLIMPMRLRNANTLEGYDIALYSDDHGETWIPGNPAEADNEFQIAEAHPDTLIYNARNRNLRSVAKSYDGGITWTSQVNDSTLTDISHGCQASVFAKDNILYFCGIDGIPMTDDFDERANLALYKSDDCGDNWTGHVVLYEPASGYACIDMLPDGKMVIIFEAGDTPGFTRKSVPGIQPPQRPAGWMRLDMITLDPQTIFSE